MAALSAEESQRKTRRRRLAKGIAIGALAVGIPALLRRFFSRQPRPLPAASWGRAQTYRWGEVDVVFERLGQGDPIVLLHSLGPGHDGAQWRHVAERLAKRWQVLAPDLPGWGRSGDDRFEPGPERYVEFVADFLARVARAPAVLVAAGHAATFAVAAADADPTAVRALGLVAPRGIRRRSGARGTVDRVVRRLIRTPVVGSSAIEAYISRRAIERHLEVEVYAAPERVDVALVDHHHASSHQPGTGRALEAFLAGDLDLDVGEELVDLELPVWIAWGRRARSPSIATADLWLREVPSAHLDVFEGAGVLAHAEAPDAFCQRLEEFLDRAL